MKSKLLVCWSLSAVMALSGMPAFAAKPAAAAKAAGAPSTARAMNCSWDRPGHNPYMGDVVGAIDRYADIPADVRARLKKRMAAREYDDLVSIKRDSIAGKQSYDPAIRDMHFGWNSVCDTVTRDKWTPQMEERGLVYCEGTTCILVPTVCRNVSRIDRAASTAAAAPAAPPSDEIDMPPTAAGEPVEPAAPDDFAGLPPPGAGPVPATGLSAVPLGPTAFIPGSSGGGSIPGPTFPPSPPTIPLGGGGNISPPPVPEPGTWAMMAGGLLMLALMRRRAARVAPVRARRDA